MRRIVLPIVLAALSSCGSAPSSNSGEGAGATGSQVSEQTSPTVTVDLTAIAHDFQNSEVQAMATYGGGTIQVDNFVSGKFDSRVTEGTPEIKAYVNPGPILVIASLSRETMASAAKAESLQSFSVVCDKVEPHRELYRGLKLSGCRIKE